MPRGEEELARLFYQDALGLTEVEKPPSLTGRGGCWFRSIEDDIITAEIHVGVDEPFVPAKKAHPALVVDSLADLDEMAARIASAGFEVSHAERHSFEGYVRFHTRDGFGNRVEVMTSRV
jgi:catechol 2,3-dioxygenase-like lactoylglutathione lyase family enzyme